MVLYFYLNNAISNKARGYHSKWGFKYFLDNLLGNDFLEKLSSKEDPSRKLWLIKGARRAISLIRKYIR